MRILNIDKVIPIKRNHLLIIFLVIYFIIGISFAFYDTGYYTVDSREKLQDLIQAKAWLIISLLMGVVVYYARIDRRTKLWGWTLLTSFYFVVLYALLYKGTDFGLNGFWGDNANRLALTTKFREFSSIFQDWFYKDLPSFYPPLWFFLSGKLAWLFGIEGYKTIKLGYFVIFTFYPIILYYVWSRIVSKNVAFLIMFLVIFFKDLHLDYVYYEHITAALFIPWWLYFIEDIKRIRVKNFRWYVLGGLLGALIFMTYFYWFYIGIILTFIRWLLLATIGKKPFLKSPGLGHKFILASVVVIFTSVFWGPLVLSIFRLGAESMQNKWFHSGYLSIDVPFFDISMISIIYLVGLLYMTIRYRKILNANYILILLSFIVMILIDRILCMYDSSIQTRKLYELFPVFLAVPSAFGIAMLYRILSRNRKQIRVGLMFITTIALLYVGNNHSQMLNVGLYKTGINNRVPTADLDVFRTVDYSGSVFLTTHYTEAGFLPYYLFISRSGSAAHIASRFDRRIEFLKYLGRLDDPAQVAFLMKNNCFDTIDYFYLPVDTQKKVALLDIYPLYFAERSVKVEIEFPTAITTESEYFELKHQLGMYAISAPDKPILDIFIQNYDSTSLRSRLDEYNRLNLAATFLPKVYADSIRPFAEKIYESFNLQSDRQTKTALDHDVELIDLQFEKNPVSQTQKMKIIFRAGKRFRANFIIFIHAYPVKDKASDDTGRSRGFVNLDINPRPPTPKWIRNELILLEKVSNLKAGEYSFHIGFYNVPSGRLDKTCRTGPIKIR